MEGCGLAVTITALAVAISAQIEDAGDLALLAAAATQLGDTLALLSLERERCAAREAQKQEAASPS